MVLCPVLEISFGPPTAESKNLKNYVKFDLGIFFLRSPALTNNQFYSFPPKEKDGIQLVYCDQYFNPDHFSGLSLQKKTIMHSGIYHKKNCYYKLSRVEIFHDRRDQQLCKIFASCVIFFTKQCVSFINFR